MSRWETAMKHHHRPCFIAFHSVARNDVIRSVHTRNSLLISVGTPENIGALHGGRALRLLDTLR